MLVLALLLAAAALLLVLVHVSELLVVVGATHTLELELVHTLDELAEVEAAAAALLLLIAAQSERLRRRGLATDAFASRLEAGLISTCTSTVRTLL